MNSDILNILKKYREGYDLYKCENDKENVRAYSMHGRLPIHNYKQDATPNIKALAKKYQIIIDNIISDGNKVFQCYEQILNESAQQFQIIKQQLQVCKRTAIEQRRDHQALVDFLNTKINTLKCQISKKQEQLSQMSQKYQYFSFKISQAHNEQRQKIQNINEQLIKSSLHYENKISCSKKQMDQVKVQIQELLTANEMLLNENYNLKDLNDTYMRNIQYLKNKLDAQKDIIHEQPSENIQIAFNQYSSLPKDKNRNLQSIEQQQGYIFQELKMNDYHEGYTNAEKEVLNLSEHYSKFNRTQEFRTKEKSNYEFIIMDSDQGKSFLRKKDKQRDTALQKQNYLLKINSKSTDKDVKKNDERVISEIKQFKMSENNTCDIPAVNLYFAFFKLLVQCEKLNSKYFNHILDVNLEYLYDQFLQNNIPYYQWQSQIKNILNSKLLKKGLPKS